MGGSVQAKPDSGDHDFWKPIFRAQYLRLVALAASLLGHDNRSKAEDVVQGVFERAMKYSRPVPNPAAFLAESVRNACASVCRMRAVEPLSEEAANLSTDLSEWLSAADEYLIQKDRAERFRSCVARLAIADQKLIELSMAGHSQSEIAKRVNLNQSTVSRHLKRIRRRLRAMQDMRGLWEER